MDAKDHTLALYLLDALSHAPDAKVPSLFRIARTGLKSGAFLALVQRLEDAFRAGALSAMVQTVRAELV